MQKKEGTSNFRGRAYEDVSGGRGRSGHTNKIETQLVKKVELYKNMNPKEKEKKELIYYVTMKEDYIADMFSSGDFCFSAFDT